MTEVTTQIEPPTAAIPWTYQRPEPPAAARHFNQWWPAGLLLSAWLYAITYLRACSRMPAARTCSSGSHPR